MPAQGWPRGPNPQKQLNDREIPLKIVQLTKSKVKEPLLNLGITGMKAKGREKLLKDLKTNRFRLVHKDVDSDIEREAGDEEDGGNTDGSGNTTDEGEVAVEGDDDADGQDVEGAAGAAREDVTDEDEEGDGDGENN